MQTNDIILLGLLGLLTAGLTVALLRWLGRRDSQNRTVDRLAQLEAELQAARDTRAELEKRFAVEQHKSAQAADLSAALAEREAQIEEARSQRAGKERELATAVATLSHAQTALDDLKLRLEGAERDREAARSEIGHLRQQVAIQQETLEQERRRADEKLALLGDAKASLAAEFKLLADEVVKRQGESLTQQNKDQMDVILLPLREKLAEFQLGLQSAHSESVRERATLAEQIRSLTETSMRMSSETQSLTQALKGKSQTQGAWGEMILTSILEKSGLREGEEYVTQQSQTSDEGQRQRLDVIVSIPGGQRVVIDAKVSLTAFEAYVRAESDALRDAELSRHVSSMRSHIRTLAAREYQTTTDGSLDYVIMFVPIEGALAAAVQMSADLTHVALENNVVIATPTTLMIALRTVANVWRVERRNRNADAIAERAGKVYDKFVGFVGDMKKLDERLVQARYSFNEAMGKLSTGHGNLIRQVEQLKEMGAKTGKALPAGLLVNGDEEPQSALQFQSVAALEEGQP